jgi:hypothetical protein
MRFRGGGVGHKSMREMTNLFKMDHDRLDVGVTLDIDDVAVELDGDDEPEKDEIVDEDTVNQEEIMDTRRNIQMKTMMKTEEELRLARIVLPKFSLVWFFDHFW